MLAVVTQKTYNFIKLIIILINYHPLLPQNHQRPSLLRERIPMADWIIHQETFSSIVPGLRRGIHLTQAYCHCGPLYCGV